MLKYISKIYTVIFLAVIGVVCLTATVAGVNNMFVSLKSENDVIWDGAAQYPFKENSADKSGTASEKDAGVLQKLQRKIKTYEEKIESAVTEYYPFRMTFVLMNKAWDKYICGMNMTTSLNGTQLEKETVLRQEDGMLVYFFGDYDITEKTQAVVDFGDEMTAQGRSFLYFETPVKSGDIDSKYLNVFPDYTEETQREIKEVFLNNDINYVSCTEYINDQGLKPEEVFFVADHHWLPQAGLWACELLADALNETAGYQIDSSIFDESNYEISTFRDFFIGSLGKKVTEIYADIDDFSTIIPKYDSNLTVFHSTLNETLTGTIAETMLNQEQLEKPKIYERYAYSYYSYGDEALIQIHNNNLSDGRRILFIKESYADCMAPYLSNIAEYVDFIDLRHFGGSLHTYIEQTDPDTVALIFGPRRFISDNVLDFS